MDKLQAMRIFRRVAELGGFAVAARDLDLAPASVSKHVAHLEQALGVKLIHRTTRRMTLTDVGAVYLERIRYLLDELEETECAISGLYTEPRGLLRVNAPMSFGLLQIAHALPSFMERYPDIQIDVSFSDRVVDLIEEGVDVALRIRTHLEDSSQIARRLAPVRRVLCAAPSYLARAGEPHSVKELQQHDCLIYKLSASPRRWNLGGEEISVDGRMYADNSLVLREALLAGHGIALIPTFMVGEDLRAGRLLRLLPDLEPEGHHLFAVYPPGRQLSAKVRLFVDYLNDWVGSPPRWDRVCD
ncbi:LysR family transcriptional regulator [Halomonas beimenensis]|uniref:Transcriptional regulator, LysR family n=1 Tax=Halomonas beimenensis TaxID=475662 RepID=A0A291P566_9GAMM|nr:LysR family transcriptional regulator [Halomonas beimenensis]ATJ82002.1 transcriptional regulator, LysR family [Halomonas beimenensis]